MNILSIGRFTPLLGSLAACALLAAIAPAASAEPNFSGETGYVNMPDGRVEADGTFRMGYSVTDPYANMWSSITLLPRLEFYARYQRIMSGAIGANNPYWEGYGDYKDKVISGKLLLLEEDRALPSLALGINDVQGTGLFRATYLAASKRFGALDATLGFGTGRIDGAFAGARYAPAAWDGFALVAEYDANDYPNDHLADITGMDERGKGVGLGVEYRWGWLGTQFSHRGGRAAINVYASIPFQSKEFIPKFEEPAADTEIVPRPTLAQWNADPQYREAMTERLLNQDFKNVHVDVSDGTASATLTNTRISLASRAVGRAARSIVLSAPQEVSVVKVHYAVYDMPLTTYTFTDIQRLQRYFDGLESRKQLAHTVSIDYAEPHPVRDNSEMLAALPAEYSSTRLDNEDGDIISYRSESARLDKLRVAPGLGFYFNDPSGALRYETFINGVYGMQVKDGLFFKAGMQLTLLQNISGVRQESNSLLPHVRTDVADYKKNGNLKLTHAVLNKFYHPGKRVYARASAGLYEEMFGGGGGQLLYFPEQGPWALDVAVDALRQRDVGGGFTFRDYSTVTALATLHYRFKREGVTAALRAGRFLAGDEGARVELKRTFRSGFEVGVWYTLTNGNDITGPGTPDNPYNDKGVFMSIPLGSMLTRDTQAIPRISISPWTRDVGQMVQSPGDLYDMLEPAYVNMHDHDGLQYLGDLDDHYER
jgi:hypothetical protein